MAQGDIDKIAKETGFSGVVRIDRAGQIEFAKAYGLANRAYRVPNSLDTRFGIASGSKGFTAVAVLSLVHDGVLELSTTARSLLGEDLPLIADDVTVEHLLTHSVRHRGLSGRRGRRRHHRLLRRRGARADYH